MKSIELTKGKVAWVDDADYEILKKYKWHSNKIRNTWYAYRTISIYMHREIMELKGKNRNVVDHINGNGLDNRKSNLRLATMQQNSWNTKTRENTRSRFRGVCWDKEHFRWRAQIVLPNKKVKYLGLYSCDKDAARAYNKAAFEQRGEYARLNAIEEAI